MDIKKNISKNIKYLRKKKGLSQIALSKELGCTNTTISNWEVGYRTPEVVDLPSIAKYFNISIDELLTVDLSKQ